MDFDAQLQRYFGTADIAAITPPAMESGVDRMRVDLGMLRDPGQRFALWAVMHMLGEAPALDVTFKDARERDAARDFMELVERNEDDAV